MSMDKTVAIIDVGSNSIKLLVAKLDAGQKIQVLCHKSEETRISAGIGQGPLVLDASLMQKGVVSIKNLLDAASFFTPSEVLIVATSAVRDASNGSDFCDLVKQKTGHELRILTGDEEALGISRGIATDPSLKDFSEFCLFDLGGGSMELISYEQGKVMQATSLPLGAVRLTELFIEDPHARLDRETANAIGAHVQQTIENSEFDFPHSSQPLLVGTGGAVTVVRAILGLVKHKPLMETPSRCTLRAMERLFANVATKGMDERLKIKGLPEKRADIFPAAVAVILTLMRMNKSQMLYHSFHNLRFGLASELLTA